MDVSTVKNLLYTLFIDLDVARLVGVYVYLPGSHRLGFADQKRNDFFRNRRSSVVFGWLYEVSQTLRRPISKDPKNAGKFINTGVWKQSRHPNYVGELVLWTGITIIAAPVYQGAQWLA